MKVVRSLDVIGGWQEFAETFNDAPFDDGSLIKDAWSK